LTHPVIAQILRADRHRGRIFGAFRFRWVAVQEAAKRRHHLGQRLGGGIHHLLRRFLPLVVVAVRVPPVDLGQLNAQIRVVRAESLQRGRCLCGGGGTERDVGFGVRPGGELPAYRGSCGGTVRGVHRVVFPS